VLSHVHAIDAEINLQQPVTQKILFCRISGVIARHKNQVITLLRRKHFWGIAMAAAACGVPIGLLIQRTLWCSAERVCRRVGGK
jgi:hypothetical protein